MSTYIIIPARLESQRLPQKLLMKMGSGTILSWTVGSAWRAAQQNKIDGIFVATDSEKIRDEVLTYPVPIKVVKTDHCANGTVRVQQACEFLGLKGNDVIINWQADYPGISHQTIGGLLALNRAFPFDITTIMHEAPVSEEHMYKFYPDMINPHKPENVKVVEGFDQRALYFSRSLVPFNASKANIHAGIYCYSVNLLRSLPNNSPLHSENLEQLHWLYKGYKVRLYKTNNKIIGIDTKEDYEQFKNSINRKWAIGTESGVG